MQMGKAPKGKGQKFPNGGISRALWTRRVFCCDSGEKGGLVQRSIYYAEGEKNRGRRRGMMEREMEQPLLFRYPKCFEED